METVTSWCGTRIWEKPDVFHLRVVISYYMICLVSDTTKNNRNHKILRFFYDKDHPIFYFELFDFKTKRFCQPLPFHYTAEFENVALSCVGEEKLAVLYKHEGTMEIWITTNIEHDAVSWSNFLKVEMILLNGFPDDFSYDTETLTESSFIDEEKKIAVVCN
ncbi:unnamed protein product, partial [Brassica napus]